MLGRRRGPGLIGTMARTAVIAGTATRVSGSVAAKQQQQAAGQQAAQQQALQQAAEQAVAQAQAPASATPPSAGGGDLVAELQKLAGLRDAGILTEEEFTAAKARILA